MLAVGHIALGYLAGKTSSRVLKARVDLPFVFLFSVLPDIDLFIPILKHRGPTHSFILAFLLLVALSAFFGRKGIFWSILYALHITADLFTGGGGGCGGVQVLWPVDRGSYSLSLSSSPYVELTLFAVSTLIMLKAGDLKKMLRPHPHNLALIPSLAAICSPLFLEYPVAVPTELVAPHLVYLALFLIALSKDLAHHIKRTRGGQK
jgi:membrane-bound metal-dependent hydrolase YbcI (DUF457 family)